MKKDSPVAEKFDEKQYESQLKELHVQLVQLQEWLKREGRKVCVLFEGRDGAGKGGVIKALTERVSPRVFRVVALAAPTDREKSQMYIQRYMPHLPAGGEITLFDRSWYNRAGVERVMGFCSKAEVKNFLAAVPLVEKAIVESGVILIKYWLDVDSDEQTKRLESRIHDGRKVWKLSPMDIASYEKWDDYTEARDDMFAATHTEWAPWYVVNFNDKRRGRLNLISHLLSQIPYETARHDKIKLPKRKVRDDNELPNACQIVPELF